jgi:Fe-S-cluster containining protein
VFTDLPQFVPQEVCLSCDGCCRFKDHQSVWRPKTADQEKKKIDSRRTLAERIFSQPSIGKDDRLTTVMEQGVCRCKFFDLSTHHCRIYQNRPFECQLYPFLMAKKQDGIYLAVHLSCPHVMGYRHSKTFEEYFLRLKDYFQRETIKNFIEQNQRLAGDYSEYDNELEYLIRL